MKDGGGLIIVHTHNHVLDG